MAHRELAVLLELLRNVDHNFRIHTIRHPPVGFSWCVVGTRVFIARHVLRGPRLHDTVAAILAVVSSARPSLRLIQGGSDPDATVPLRATGTTGTTAQEY